MIIRLTYITLLFLCAEGLCAQQTYMVRLRHGASIPDALGVATPLLPPSYRTKNLDAPLSNQGATALQRLLRTYVVKGVSEASLGLLRADANIEEVWPMARFSINAPRLTSDSLIESQYALRMLRAGQAWPQATGKGMLVGVLDTGIDWNHPDLAENVWINSGEDRNKNGRFDPWPSTVEIGGVFGDLDGIDDDGNGWIDDVIGYDFVDQDVGNVGDYRDRDPVPVDEHGHGTSVSGVIAAVANNGIGIAGLAFEAKVVALRAFDATGNAEEDDVAVALMYAALMGIPIVNMSFGDGVDSPVLADAVAVAAEAGCLLVASAGNTGQVSRQFPAGYNAVMAVGATNEQDRRAPFSSTGPLVDVVAPGQDIWTTAIGGRYRSVNGTSFAAPYVAAAAALLWQARPLLTWQEIRGILRETSVDMGPRGFDPEFGNGRLDVVRALALAGASAVVIAAPQAGTEVDLRRTSSLAVRGTVTATQFVGYAVLVGREGSLQWDTVARSSAQVVDAPLANIDCTMLGAGEYLLRLVVEQTTGRTLEQQVRFRVASDVLAVEELEAIPAWEDDRRVLVVTSKASRPTRMRASVWDGVRMREVDDMRHRARLHSVAISNVATGVPVDVEVIHVADGGDTVRQSTRVTIPTDAASRATMTQRGGANIAGYVLNDVRPLYGDGQPVLMMNDLASGAFGPLKAVVPGTLSWLTRDSLNEIWIPRGIGDINDDGRLELLCHVVGKAIVFGQAEQNGSLFARTLWADTTGDVNGTALADITGDGVPEILCLSRRGLLAYSFQGGQVRLIGIAENTTPPAVGTAQNRVDEVSVAVGDFDGNGRIDVAFSDTDGDLIITEWTGSEFVQKHVVLNEGQGGSGYVHARDVDGDGRPEIIHGVPDATSPNADREYGRSVWTYTLYKGTATGQYSVAWQDRFYGVRYGIGYRNGVEGGQLDMRGGDEVVISVYPRLYVFRWDASRSTMEPYWFTDGVATPRVAVADFLKTGINQMLVGISRPEIGFISSSMLFQADTAVSRLPAPPGVRADILGGSHVRVSWGRVRGARAYAVELSESGGSFERMAETAEPFWHFDSARQGSAYRVRVVALAATAMDSRASAPVSWTMPSEIAGVQCQPMRITLDQARQALSFRVTFDAAPASRPESASSWLLVQGRLLLRATTVVPSGAQSYVVTFQPSPSIELGELTLVVPQVESAQGMPSAGTAFTIQVDPSSERQELFLTSLTAESRSRILIRFSEAVEPKEVEEQSRYVLRPVGTVATATWADDTTVVLAISPDSPIGARGLAYTITASDMRSKQGKLMTTGAGNTLGFVISASSIDDVYPFPHPVRTSMHDRVTFANIPVGTSIDILDQNLRSIRNLNDTEGLGGLTWDLTDANGNPVLPGIYFFDARWNEDRRRGKVVIQR
jgi:subtilisin family serine protease